MSLKQSKQQSTKMIRDPKGEERLTKKEEVDNLNPGNWTDESTSNTNMWLERYWIMTQ